MTSSMNVGRARFEAAAPRVAKGIWRHVGHWCMVTALWLGFLMLWPSAAQAETITYYYTNQQGTPLATADAAGNILSTADYRPYGVQALGAPEAGPGYTGHINDPDSELVYMQARYYSASIGTFLSVDPKPPKAGDLSSFNRYAYANRNPISYFDPDGNASQLNWTAPNQVTYTVPYTIGLVGGVHLPITPAQINAAVNSRFSGTVRMNGTEVTITARAIEANGSNPGGHINIVTFLPKLGLAFTNRVGGDHAWISSDGPNAANADNVAHEVGGHFGGAGDQYVTGTDVNGNEITTPPPGASGVMYDLNGKANSQTLLEILRSPDATNTCAPGVSAANGKC